MKPWRIALLILCVLPGPFVDRFISAQTVAPSTEEIPLEKCDVLPVVVVRIGGSEIRLLLDTGATSILNLKSFDSGSSTQVSVSSWVGTAATSAREVLIPELSLGSHHLRDLKLPAIDLSPIGEACGGRIDGILGVDLLDKLGMKIDLKRKVAVLDLSADEARAVYAEMETAMHPCQEAFNSGKAELLEPCFDPDIVLYTPWGEFRGRKPVIEYLGKRFLKFAPELHFEIKPHDIRMLGDALWYSYDYEVRLPAQTISGRGMAICRKTGGHWHMLNMHNSLVQPEIVQP
ncbi:MAG TPA: DUF4440 domain-containing protein [Verrucomicrobiae bacterium]|nr:DUF4440 domain-containing protein [Verrucomicrobiae bacterium]